MFELGTLHATPWWGLCWVICFLLAAASITTLGARSVVAYLWALLAGVSFHMFVCWFLGITIIPR